DGGRRRGRRWAVGTEVGGGDGGCWRGRRLPAGTEVAGGDGGCRRHHELGKAPGGYCSRSSTLPVTHSLALVAKYSAARAMSSGTSRRPKGRVAIACSIHSSPLLSSSRFTRRSPSVRVHPTLIWLTRIRSRFSSDAAFFVSVIRPPFDTE